MPIDGPMKYISKIASKANLDPKVQNHAIELLYKAMTRKVTVGKSPVGLAAAALYIANKQEDGMLTQSELAKAAGVTEVTVRNRYKGLIKSLDLRV
jgi:transcription initiation factor TFIIB